MSTDVKAPSGLSTLLDAGSKAVSMEVLPLLIFLKKGSRQDVLAEG